MSIRSPLARARGLGSAKQGVDHWWRQRLSAVALVPLSLWFAFSVASHVGDGYQAVLAWLSSPITAVALSLYLTVACYHSQLGIQVVVEDYVHHEWVKLGLLVITQFVNLLLAVAAVFALLSIAFGAAS
ncbi:MAG: succinate dehydrogenase, hydrophobic membrane anchor protein [Salinisphaera sp.]|nr:succinate dehydrogenase, hydrophobic membrane anchor protein [Salinisphaera sp.]